MLTLQLAVMLFFLFWISVSPYIQRSIHCSNFEITALPVSREVEGKLFSELRLLCYLCLFKDVVISFNKTQIILVSWSKNIAMVFRTGDLQKQPEII